eukprot:sb/3479476/
MFQNNLNQRNGTDQHYPEPILSSTPAKDQKWGQVRVQANDMLAKKWKSYFGPDGMSFTAEKSALCLPVPYNYDPKIMVRNFQREQNGWFTTLNKLIGLLNNIDSLLRLPVEGQVWYYYDVPDIQPKQATVLPVSQIPLLNGDLIGGDPQPAPRRGGEGLSSTYIKLAKAGGRKDLLLYRENSIPKDMLAYDRVDWFDHPNTSPDTNVGKPRQRQGPNIEVIQRKAGRRTKQASLLTSQAPFNTDEFLDLNDGNDSDQFLTRAAERAGKANRILRPLPPMPLPEPSIPITNVNKPALGENSEYVIGMVVLVIGYECDWSKNMSATRKQKLEIVKRFDKEQKEKLTKHLTSSKKREEEPEKPLFKLKKFTDVYPRLNLW